MVVERSNITIHLDHQSVLEMVQKAFPRCSAVTKLTLLSGGAPNILYSFKIGDDKFVLRLYTRSSSDCKIEKELHLLIESVINLPKLVYCDENHKPLAYAIFKFVSGIRVSKTPDAITATLSEKIGNTLALIHSFKFPVAGYFEDGIRIKTPMPLNSSPYLEKTVVTLTKSERVRERLGGPLVEELLQFIDENRIFFPKIGTDTCLTHANFQPANLLYQPGGSITVLGWENAHAGARILDFAVLIRHRKKIGLDMKALLKGYEKQHGIMPDNWYQSALITDFVNIITLLDAPGERPLLFDELEQVLRTTMLQCKSF